MNPILVPLRNALPLTRAAHRTFLKQTIPVSILYIDNASQDGTLEWLASLDVHSIRNVMPKSVAASWNQGLRWLFSRGAQHVLVVNNDVLLRADTYQRLLEAGGDFVTAVGDSDPECVLEMPPPSGKVRPHPDFSCYLIRKTVWDKVGEFDEKYVGAYAEDANYHLRMHRAGIHAYCIDLPFYHVACGTAKYASQREAAAINQNADKNRALFREQFGVDVGSAEYYQLFGSQDPAESQE